MSRYRKQQCSGSALSRAAPRYYLAGTTRRCPNVRTYGEVLIGIERYAFTNEPFVVLVLAGTPR